MEIIKNLILFVVAAGLYVILLPLALVYQGGKAAVEKSWQPIKDFFGGIYQGIAFLFRQMAVVIDQSGARTLAPVLNAIFLKKGSAKVFGLRDENGKYYTISAILGMNYKDKALTRFGQWFKEFLDLFERDHVIKALS